LPQFLTVLKDYEMMVFGAVMMGTMIFMPRGVVPTLAKLLAPRHQEATVETPRADGEGGG
jgi:branched-chain amino acid transport system permease protein